MSGRRFVAGFVVVVVLFAAALVWFQVFAFYGRSEVPAGFALPAAGWEGVDATSSPLKLRACFGTDPEVAAAGLEPAPDAAPLNAPFWFRCFDARAIAQDLDAGRATPYAVARDAPEGFDLMVAVYPDGRAYLWRQLNERFR